MILTIAGKPVTPAGDDVAVRRSGDVVIEDLIFGDDDRRGLVITEAGNVVIRRCRFGPIRFRPNQGWHGDAIRIEANGPKPATVLLEDVEFHDLAAGVLPIHAADGRTGFASVTLNRVTERNCQSASIVGTKFRCDLLSVNDSTIRIGSGGQLRPKVVVTNSDASIYGANYKRPAATHPAVCPTCKRVWP